MRPASPLVLPVLSASIWTVAISLGWLIPNHFRPWSTFHSDAWMALSIWFGLGALLYVERQSVHWNTLSLSAVVAMWLPWAQLIAGQIGFLGQAWMTSLYMLGFLLAMQMGQRWEMYAPGQLAQVMFGAFGLASFASFGLQLYTWFGLYGKEVTDIVSMGLVGNRLYANLGQPNLLASLLLWGLLSALFFYQERLIRASVAIVVAVCLIVGLVFTQSRTGMLSLSALLIATWMWRSKWRSRYVAFFATVLYGLYWVLPEWIRAAHQFIFLGGDSDYSRPIRTGDLRVAAWKQFATAVLEHPWLGYGWTEVAAAQVEVSNRYPPLGMVFGQSHNLFLDIVLWLGIPLGLILISIIAFWFINALKKTTNVHGLICLLALMVVGIHAMLEFPLHYAFFLLPTGILIGIVNKHSGDVGAIKTRPWTLVVLWVIAGFALAITIIDYLRSEESYNALRFEKARIGVQKTGIGKPPEVLVLTQLRGWIWAERVAVHRNMPLDELQTLDSLAQRFPTGWTIYRVAKALVMSSQPERAQYWIDRICVFSPVDECNVWRQTWINEQKVISEMSQVHWRSMRSD